MSILVTGAAGFIGSNLVRRLRVAWPDVKLVSLDCLTYAGNRENLADLEGDARHVFERVDIVEPAEVERVFREHDVRGVFHLAAESHVDRSIHDPMQFVRTNIEGTVQLLRGAQAAWAKRTTPCRFLHVSTDEVFGDLGPTGKFSETTPYAPHSPYSASKASSDHLVRAWHHTYGLPVVITNCSNNYGPFQFPEKLIPVVISRILANDAIPVYGRGENVRDWLYVEDHCDALLRVFERGQVGETYCIGGDNEVRNIDIVERLADEVDRQLGRGPGTSRALIRFVEDRPGHDRRYAIDGTRIRQELGWAPKTPFEEGIARTVAWYVAHQDWSARVKARATDGFEAAWYKDRR